VGSPGGATACCRAWVGLRSLLLPLSAPFPPGFCFPVDFWLEAAACFGQYLLVPGLHHILGVIVGTRRVAASAAARAGDADVPREGPSGRCGAERFGERMAPCWPVTTGARRRERLQGPKSAAECLISPRELPTPSAAGCTPKRSHLLRVRP